MISIFDTDNLLALLKDFYRLTDIRITVFDDSLKEIVSYPENVAPYCQIIRSSGEGLSECMRCDSEAFHIAASRRRTFIYRCHAGLTEAITPLYVGEILVGYLMFGHVFSYSSHEHGINVIQKACSTLPVDTDQLIDALQEAVPIGEDYVRSASRILHAVASYLISEKMATLKEDELAVRLDSYISSHYTESLTSADICKELGIGKTQLYRLSKLLYGCGVAEHIRDLRIALAKDRLVNSPEMSLADVASECGYNDYNYFIYVFSKQVSCSPGAWRRKFSI